MSYVVTAVYENGVLRPTGKIRLREKQQVQVQILSEDDWQKRFDKVIKSIRSKTAKFSRKEVEKDIAEAIKEVRQSRRHGR